MSGSRARAGSCLVGAPAARWAILISALAVFAPALPAQVNDPHRGHALHETAPETSPPADTSPPPGARDPHGDSGGYTLHTGPYLVDDTHPMQHGDGHATWAFLIDRLEWVNSEPESLVAYEMKGWYGNSFRRLWIRSEGDYSGGGFDGTETELLFGQAIAPFWDVVLGVRQDTQPGADRSWLAFGLQGLAPYWFEVEATGYIGESGRPAFKLEAEHEFLLTQRLVLQPRLEISLFGRDDEINGIGSGFSEGSLGLRLRYEFSRQFAPYVGLEWALRFAQTADFAQQDDEPTRELRFLAGVRAWF